MSDSNDILNAVKMLGYLQNHSPMAVSRQKLANYLGCSTRSITRYGKKLTEVGVESCRGRDGGYFYGGKDAFPFNFSNIDDVYKLNLAINSDYVIDTINTINKSGIELSKNLIFSNSNISEEDIKKMVQITEAIYLKTSIKITYQKDGNFFDAYINPICFKNYDGVVYLFAYYSDNIHVYDLRKLMFKGYQERQFKIRSEDLEHIRKLPNHEIYGADIVCSFKVRVYKVAYNRFKKAFKDLVQLNYDSTFTDVTIKTRSYREVVSLLLSLGANVEFLEKDNDVYRLYKEELYRMTALTR